MVVRTTVMVRKTINNNKTDKPTQIVRHAHIECIDYACTPSKRRYTPHKDKRLSY